MFAGLPTDKTEENIQARCRGVLLMAISNKTGEMVLATGNKSEMAVGYILEAFIEKDFSVDQITALGFERATVVRVLQMVKRAGYKRPPSAFRGTSQQRAFGRDWRYPIIRLLRCPPR